jgi:type I restriction enzyme S subunit
MKKYDSYKDSGIEWMGEIPSHWNISKSKFEINVINGYAFKSEDFQDDGIPVVRIGDLKPPHVDLTNAKCIDETKYKNLEAYTIVEGDLLLAMTGATIGKTAVYIDDRTSFLNQRVGLIKPLKENHKGFVKYIYESIFFKEFVNLECSGSAQENIGKSQLGELKIGIPEFEEQNAIANYLDHKTTQIETLISKKKQFIALLQEERIAVINQAVTNGLDPNVQMKDSGIKWLVEIPKHWEVKKLKLIFNSSKGLTITKENLESEGIPCVNYGEIHSKFGFEVDIDKHQLKYVNPTYLESDYKSLIQKGDFVFADTSEDISGAGNFTYLKSNHEIFAGYHTIILRALENIESRYFAYQFDSIPYRTQIRQSVKGIKVFSITQGILKNTSLWIPPIVEQRLIIEFLDIETDRILRLINSAKKEIELLKEYKMALISEIVTGKVDVRNEIIN